jgi:2,4-dienoyl-CoA reductase (NADPH2)
MENILNENISLSSPIMIGNVKVKNRIIMPAFILNFPIHGFKVSDEWKQFYLRRAEGGVGLMIVGACHVHPAGRQDEFQIGADHDDWLPQLEEIAGLIKKGGAVPALQLNHAGRYSLRKVTGMDPVAPSAIASRYTKETPRELTTGEVEEVIESFSDAAVRARNAGFEAVELLGATGYLISQFLSAVTNQRTDRFGGEFEDRLTFVKELVLGIKEKAGEDYPVIFRLSSKDNIPGGLEAEDQLQVAVKLAEWGVQLMNVTAGWHDAAVHQIGPSVPHGNFIPYAAKIKEAIDIPVSCAMRITTPELAESAVSDGRLDMVTLGRAIIADPDWANKALDGDYDAIRYCICCCHCFDVAFSRSQTECSVNAELGKERLQKAKAAKKILVIGGGPAGMEAARVLALRGHSVALHEKGSSLGGKLGIASAPPDKDEIAKLSDFQQYDLNRLGVTIKLNEDSKEFDGYDGIIVATGGKERTISIKGMDAIPVYPAGQILSGSVEPKDPVIIVGAGIVGGETAAYLSAKGHTVSLVEILDRPLMDMGPSLRWVLLGRLKKAGVNIYTSSTVSEVSRDGVVVQTQDGEKTLEAGALVIAVGYEPDAGLIDELKKTDIPFCVIGDSRSPRRIKDAVHEGFWAATDWVDELE